MKSRTVGVRLMLADYRALLEKAKRFNVQPSVYLRNLALSDLEGLADEDIQDAVATIHAEVERLRQELARLAIVLLCDAGKCKQADAKTWVLENMGHPLSVSVQVKS